MASAGKAFHNLVEDIKKELKKALVLAKGCIVA